VIDEFEQVCLLPSLNFPTHHHACRQRPAQKGVRPGVGNPICTKEPHSSYVGRFQKPLKPGSPPALSSQKMLGRQWQRSGLWGKVNVDQRANTGFSGLGFLRLM
jgi:hypothetical protein